MEEKGGGGKTLKRRRTRKRTCRKRVVQAHPRKGKKTCPSIPLSRASPIFASLLLPGLLTLFPFRPYFLCSPTESRQARWKVMRYIQGKDVKSRTRQRSLWLDWTEVRQCEQGTGKCTQKPDQDPGACTSYAGPGHCFETKPIKPRGFCFYRAHHRTPRKQDK